MSDSHSSYGRGRLAVDLLAALGLVGLYIALYLLFRERLPEVDTDQWYHKALARLWVSGSGGGLPRVWPQVEDLGWGAYFPDKEFLFHAVTAVGYLAGGDAGLALAVHAVAASTLVLLYRVARDLVAAPVAFALVSLLTLSVPYFSMRLFLLRPAIAGMFFFTLLLWGLRDGRRWKLIAGAMGFALSYHAIYVPLVAVAVLYRRDTARWALLGLGVGVLANPYFPSNLVMGFEHFQFAAFSQDLPGVPKAGELDPLSLPEFARCFGAHLLCLAGAAACGWKSRDRDLLRWLGLAGAFLVVSLLNPRGSEYWVPIVVLTAAAAWREWKPGPRAAALALAAVALVPGAFLKFQLTAPPDTEYALRASAIRAAIDRIPPEPRGAKVLNCNFGLGEYVLYQRPDLRIVDVLDPRLLYAAAPVKAEALRMLRLGRARDPHALMREVFHADYFLCDDPFIDARISRAPGLLEVSAQTDPVRVFKLDP